jgi:hypothetical protein
VITAATVSSVRLPRRYYLCFVVLANMVISLNSTNELSALNLLPYFLSKSGIAIDDEQQYLMGVVTGLAYAIGHLAMMFGALRCSSTSLAYGSLTFVLLGNMLLCLTQVPPFVHWIALIVLAVAFSTAFPALLSFIESRISITNTINCAFLATFSYLSALHSLFVGDLIKVSSVFQIVNLLLSLSVLLLFGWLHSLDRWKARLLHQLRL